MCTYLAKRGSTYYFRRAIPAELRPAFDGQSEFMRSLRVKDRERAKRLIPALAEESDRELDEARAKLQLGGGEGRLKQEAAPQSLVQLGLAEDAALEARLAEEASLRFRQREAEREKLRLRLKTLRSVELSLPEQAMRDLLREHEAKAAALTAAREFQREPAQTVARDGLAPRTSLDPQLIDQWAAERKVRTKTADAHRAVARWFKECVGERAVEEITRKDVLAFKAALLSKGTSTANAHVKISRLRSLLNFAKSNDIIESNPAEGIKINDTAGGRNKRQPFSPSSLVAIFRSPVYRRDERPTRGRGEAAYWLPLLALYTGARLEELGQLRCSDVHEQDYVGADDVQQKCWVIRITECEEDGLKLKNAASDRIVPVHPALESLGFIRFAKKQSLAGAALFPDLRPNKYGIFTAKWGEWFSKYKRETCGITDRRQVFHSFRHTFKDYARHAAISDRIQRQLMGHSAGDVADQYGAGYSLHQLVESMKRYRVPGVPLPPPPPSFRGEDEPRQAEEIAP